ncbi:MAG: ABC transporter substrate-binding protein [Anaeromicrobium sp.]|uniref:ABC transporter substrate-binding protein n=1 Tax=Anaeromicrobium sp. TaxID=1929132 RepID=UPI0025E03174|nr:ABC transporter substrate-binding protein [Anaeromicrobium sp.]MCT4592718.1 ABC transporter substrate-binding protein [Anaeromicrobium sp.]
MKKILKAMISCTLLLAVVVAFSACGIQGSQGEESVIIYTNGDEEAIASMEYALNGAGYEGKYILQSYGTSELGGKLIAEGDKIDANIVTMSSYFIESAQKQNNMFAELVFETNSLEEYPSYYTPILAITGGLFANENIMKEENLTVPTSIKDLTKAEFQDFVSIPNIMDSSTGWLLIQAIISEYGEEEGQEILRQLIKNCGPHIESSGSGPIKKVRAGEVAVGFGLRHQAVGDNIAGLPIACIDPTEGNFSLIEGIAVVDKDEEITKLAQEMAEVIVHNAREDLIKYYPVALYEGERVSDENKPGNPKKFEEALTVDILKEHQEFFKNSK